ncbi:MAG: hypothetical protein US89_C0011G0018 [Candidatus Peregrinibacteria bacterium GW2011_GWF2_38_29]|nr:MAG: hypothetical protein US89_C0011G0018 [Candidatus Peregrinibacteria bacterium GW2011_GWF2_38_29]
MNKKYKIIIAGLIAIGAIALIMFFIPNKAQTSGNEPPIDPLTALDVADQKSFDSLKEVYHESMNTLFNEAFSRITAGNALTKAPDETDTKDEACLPTKEPLNVSTYCVAVRAAKLYMDYQVRLEYVKGSIDIGLFNNSGVVGQDGIVADLAAKGKAVLKEIEDSKKALDVTVNAYKEFQYAYPMHKAYEKTFNLLVKYRDLLGEIRGQVEVFPSKFIDATTSKCE